MLDLSPAQQKEKTLQVTTAFKANLLNNQTLDKQIEQAETEIRLKESLFPKKPEPSYLTPYDESPLEHATRGIKTGIKGTLNLGWGLVAGAGAVTETAVGEGGMATRLKESAAEKYRKNAADLSRFGSATDSLTYSWNEAKEGNLEAMVDWFSHGSGYVISQLGTLLVGGGVIGQGVKVVGKKAVTQVMTGLIEKEAKRLAIAQLTKTGIKATTQKIAELTASEAIRKSATSIIAGRVGQHIGMASASFGLEGGEIMGDLAQQSIDRDTPLTGAEIGKGLTATVLAGSIEYMETLLQLKALKGTMGKFPGATNLSGKTGKLARGAVSGGKVSVAEGIQEFAQTGIEQWGKGQDLTTEEAKQERIDAAGMGMLGGELAAVGGVFSRSTDEKVEVAKKKAAKRVLRAKSAPQSIPGYKKKVETMVESEDISKYSDPKSKDYEPVTVVDTLQKINQKESITPEQKITNYDKALEINQIASEAITKHLGVINKYLDLKKTRKLTVEETEAFKVAQAEATAAVAIIEQIEPLIDSMNKAEPILDETIKEIKASLQGSDSTEIQKTLLNVFGSKGTIADADLKSALKNPKIDDSTKVVLKDVQTSQEKNQVVLDKQSSSLNKTVTQVYHDVINGSAADGFKGIESYKADIATLVQNGNIKKAKAQFIKFKAFTARHNKKVQVFSRVLEATLDSKGAISKADAKAMEQYNKDRKTDYDFSENFRPSIEMMQAEASALTAGLIVVQNMITPPIFKVQPAVEKVASTESERTVTTEAKAQGVTEKEDLSKMEPLSAGRKTKKEIKTLDQLSKSELQTLFKNTDKNDKIKRNILEKLIREKHKDKSKTKPIKQDVSQPETSSPLEHEVEIETSIKNKKKVSQREDSPTAESETETVPIAEQFTDNTDIDTKSLIPSETNKEDVANNRLWVNTLKAFYKKTYGKEGPISILNKVTDFVNTMREKIKTKNHSLTPDQETATIALMQFNKQFSETFLKTFKPKKKEWAYHEDPVNYFRNNDGELDPNFLMAMSATAWKWLATQGTKTLLNDDATIRKMFGLPESQEISNEVRELLVDLGSSKDYLSNVLGKDVIKMFEIKPTQDIGVFDQENIERAVGTLMLATLDRMGRIKRTSINSGLSTGKKVVIDKVSGKKILETSGKKISEPEDATMGYFGLLNHLINDPQAGLSKELIKTFFLSKSSRSKVGTSKMDFFAITGNYISLKDGPSFKVTSSDNIQTKEDYNKAKGVWEKLFGLPADVRDYSFDKPEWDSNTERWPLTRTGESATIVQTNNLKEYIQQPITLAHKTMNLFTFLSTKGKRTATGAVDIESATYDRVKSRESINRKIELDMDATRFWLHNAKNQEDGYKSKFYIQSYFIANGRMQQTGSIQPQNSLLHRWLFKNDDWSSTFDKSNEQDSNLFKAAVGLSLGIDPTKEASFAVVLQKTDDMLNNPIIQKALKAIDIFLESADQHTIYSPDEMVALRKDQPELEADILVGIAKGGENLHTMKGLLEYQRFQRHTTGQFTTSLPIELDGQANGPTIGNIQLLLSQPNTTNLGIMASEGVIFTEEEIETDTVPYDPYQAIGAIWGRLVTELKEKAITAKDTVLHNRLEAAEFLLGSLIDSKGFLDKAVRKLAKNRAVGALYGSGHDTVKRGLVLTIIEDGIKAKLEKILEDPTREVAVDELRQLVKSVNTLTGNPKSFFIPKNIAGTAGNLNKKALLQIKLDSEIFNDVATFVDLYHGKALTQAIDKIYGDIQKARAPLNKAVTIAVAYYNAAHKTLIREHYDKFGNTMTKGQLRVIQEQLKDLIPVLISPQGGRIPLAKFTSNAKKTTAKEGTVKQSYQQDDSGDYYSPMNTQAKRVGMLSNPGVYPVVTGVQNFDASSANRGMGNDLGIGVLGVHDGFFTSITNGSAMAQLLNKSLYMDLKESSLPKQITDTLLNAQKAFDKFASNRSNQTLIDLVDSFKALKLTEGIYPDSSNIWIKTMDEVLKENTVGIKAKGKKKAKLGTTDLIDISEFNKKRILNAATGLNHYYHKNGMWSTGNTAQNRIGKIQIVESDSQPGLYSQAAINQKKLAEQNLAKQELIKAFANQMIADANEDTEQNKSLGSNAKQTISIDPKDYALEQEINKQNVLEIYEQIKDDSTVHDTPEHDNHLKRILSTLVQTVLNPIDLFMKSNPEIEPEGKFVQYQGANDQVFMSHQNQIIGPIPGALNNGIRMSSGEVYTHELLHVVLETGLRLNHRLQMQVDTLYRLAYRNIDYKVFLNDPTINIQDPANQYEVKAALERYDYIFRGQPSDKTKTDAYTKIKRNDGSSNHLDEFITLGLTNKNFMKALANIALPERVYTTSTWKDIQSGNIQQTLMNIGQKIFDFFYSKFSSSKNEATMSQELERLATLLVKIDSNHKSKLFDAQSKTEGQYQKVADLANKYIKKVAVMGPGKIIKNLHNLTIAQKDKDTMLGKVLNEHLHAYDRLEHGLGKSLISELRGKTDRIAWLYQLLNRRDVFLDSAKTTVTSDTQKVATGVFKKELTLEQKANVTKIGLQPDTVTLVDSLGLKGISKVLGDPNKLRLAIEAVIAQIKADPDLAPHETYYKNACNAMGHFMIHSRGRKGERVIQNSLVIAELTNRTNVKVPLTKEQIDRAVKLVDQLGSLYALQHTAKKARLEFKELIDIDPNGVRQVFALHQVLKKQSLEVAFHGNERKFIKGYTKEIVNSRIAYEYGTAMEEEEFKKRAFTKSPEPIVRDKKDPMRHIDIYVYTAQTGRINDYMATTFSLTGNRAKGIDSEGIIRQTDITTKKGKHNNAKIIRDKAKVFNQMADPNYMPPLTIGNQMIPLLDETGTVIKYRYMAAETTKDNFLEKVNDYDIILGAMAGQILDKQRSPIINEELIDGLKVMFDSDYQDNPGLFVEIGPNSSDPRLRDIYHMMPEASKQYADAVWGGPSMFIPKDILDISFGYRHYSIVEAFAKDPQDRVYIEKILIKLISILGGEEKGILRANTIENVMTELAGLAKNNIIVRSLSVTLNNFGSNIIFLKAKSVPTAMIFKLGWEAIAMGTKYQADMQRLGELEIKRKMMLTRKTVPVQLLHDLENEIMQLKNTIERNPTTQAIESGMMPQLIDDVETTISGSNFPSDFEKVITKQTDKLPQSVQNVGKVMFLTQDTQAYQVLNNAVKMTDFIGRYVLYNYYTDKARGKKQMKHKKAVAAVLEDFVNFSPPTHRMVEYLNTIGLLRFTKYGIRILKVIKESAVDKPFEIAMAILMSSHLGLDNINNSIPGVTKNMFSNFGDPFSFMYDTVGKILPIDTFRSFIGK